MTRKKSLPQVRLVEMIDVTTISKKLRKTDIEGIRASTGEKPFQAIKRNVEWSDISYTIFDEYDGPIAIFGIVPDGENQHTGIVWFVASDDLLKHSLFFLRNSRKWIKRLNQKYQRLWNLVDARNKAHIRWLEWSGFTIIKKVEKSGFEQRPFYEFEIIYSP